MTESVKNEFGGKSELCQLAKEIIAEFEQAPEVGTMKMLNADDGIRMWIEEGGSYIQVLDLIEKQADKLLSCIKEDLNRSEMEQIIYGFEYMQGCLLSVGKQMEQKEKGQFQGTLKGEYFKTDYDRASKLFKALDKCKESAIGVTPPEYSCSYLKKIADVPIEERLGIVAFLDFIAAEGTSMTYEQVQQLD